MMSYLVLFLCFLLRIASPAFLFSRDFLHHQIGSYTVSMRESDWPTSKWNNGVAEGRVSIVLDSISNRNVLDVVYPANEYGPGGGGAQWRIDLEGEHEELFSAYYLFFPEGWDGVRGGKLPGLCGNECPTGGQDVTGSNGFSQRYMFRPDDELVIYSYDMKKDVYGDDYPLSIPLVRNQWIHLEQRVKLNTPGQQDGELDVWYNGQLALSERTMEYRSVDSVKIDRFYFSTFYGGGDQSWSPTKEEHIRFDRFEISDERIGYIEEARLTAAIATGSVLGSVAAIVGVVALVGILVSVICLGRKASNGKGSSDADERDDSYRRHEQ